MWGNGVHGPRYLILRLAGKMTLSEWDTSTGIPVEVIQLSRRPQIMNFIF